jgi:PIN domain
MDLKHENHRGPTGVPAKAGKAQGFAKQH